LQLPLQNNSTPAGSTPDWQYSGWQHPRCSGRQHPGRQYSGWQRPRCSGRQHPRLAVFRMAVPSLFRQAVPPAEKVARDAGGIFKLPRHLKFRKMLIAELQHFGNSLFKSGAAA